MLNKIGFEVKCQWYSNYKSNQTISRTHHTDQQNTGVYAICIIILVTPSLQRCVKSKEGIKMGNINQD